MNQSVSTNEDSSVSITLDASVGNDANGSVSITGDGGVVNYRPRNGFTGIDNFTYTVSDGLGGTATANVTVDVRRK